MLNFIIAKVVVLSQYIQTGWGSSSGLQTCRTNIFFQICLWYVRNKKIYILSRLSLGSLIVQLFQQVQKAHCERVFILGQAKYYTHLCKETHSSEGFVYLNEIATWGRCNLEQRSGSCLFFIACTFLYCMYIWTENLYSFLTHTHTILETRGIELRGGWLMKPKRG